MIVEKYMVIGICPLEEYIKDVNTNNNTYFNKNLNGFSLDFKIDTFKSLISNIYTDDKQFDSEIDAVNYIFSYLKFQKPNVIHWSVIKTYVEIYDLLEQRKYKLKRIIKNIKN